MSLPEDNPMDDEQPTKEEWEAYERTLQPDYNPDDTTGQRLAPQPEPASATERGSDASLHADEAAIIACLDEAPAFYAECECGTTVGPCASATDLAEHLAQEGWEARDVFQNFGNDRRLLCGNCVNHDDVEQLRADLAAVRQQLAALESTLAEANARPYTIQDEAQFLIDEYAKAPDSALSPKARELAAALRGIADAGLREELAEANAQLRDIAAIFGASDNLPQRVADAWNDAVMFRTAPAPEQAADAALHDAIAAKVKAEQERDAAIRELSEYSRKLGEIPRNHPNTPSHTLDDAMICRNIGWQDCRSDFRRALGLGE